MTGKEIRDTFLKFFEQKNHQIVPSSPMVVKDDPTLMFTNAGMNQFKDWFLGNSPAKWNRVADTQKCLRVSGKHNDLEEVGHDTYHHTMFEMLGNWSFGDYFKKEAIEWAWELLTEVYKIDKKNIYVTVFEGDKNDNTPEDKESKEEWKKHINPENIIYGNKKDNFWEMGESGPCGPCSEIHVDIRDQKDKEKINGKDLVNKDHPQVIEVWNLVFIQYNRLANQSLVNLPQKHVDTGMGLERLCMVLQNKKSNYDTDIFSPLINQIAEISNIKYGSNKQTDVAIRVVADHVRAVSFAIADGQLPSNVKAGYVIRRILRRAIRYSYSYLNISEPFIYKLVNTLVKNMGYIFPELVKQEDIITKVILEEENSFLKTLSHGIVKFNNYIENNKETKVIDGKFAFEMYDTYGFPFDLTQLMSKELSLEVDQKEFESLLNEQKERSRNSAATDTSDWVEIINENIQTEFVGYDYTNFDVNIVKYRKATNKGKVFYQIVLDKTPFYAESGGQVGDTGILKNQNETLNIFDTKKENNLILHFSEQAPNHKSYNALVDIKNRKLTAKNHTATHLLHHALREVLGKHVEQKGSYVCADYLRFDFAHFQKMTEQELLEVEKRVNKQIQDNFIADEKRDSTMKEAQERGAIAFFGEKYGDKVRVLKFGDSIELCGGTHVNATGDIGLFKIKSESAIAAGIRRIEAITSDKAWEYIYDQEEIIELIKQKVKNQINPIHAIESLQNQLESQKKELTELKKNEAKFIVNQLSNDFFEVENIKVIAKSLNKDSQILKDISLQITENNENTVVVLTSNYSDKPFISVAISNNLVSTKKLHAGNIVKKLAAIIEGGGGGQPNYASAGGKKLSDLNDVLTEVNKNFVRYL